MDSLTQIVLGAAVGEAVAGHKLGAKAAFWGAIGGTIPDLDVFFMQFYSVFDAALVHRGLSHSLFFAGIAGPVLGWIFYTITKKKESMKMWILLWFLSIVTHPILDMFTNYGTQFFWPFSPRITFNSVFVIDPLYTVPFMVLLIGALFMKRGSRRRKIWNWSGIIYSTSYLIYGVCLKLFLFYQAPSDFQKAGFEVDRVMVTPMPLTSFYWEYIAENDSNYMVGYRSIFGTFKPSEIEFIPKNHHLFKNLKWKTTSEVEKINYMTNGYFALEKRNDTLMCYDLRFGTTSQITAGVSKQPLMGFGMLVHNGTVQKSFRIRNEKAFKAINFGNYLNKIAGK